MRSCLTVQGYVLVKLDSFRRRKLERLDVQVVALQAPGKVLRGDHVGSEAPKGVLVLDIEGGCLVDDGALVCGGEGGEGHGTEGHVGGPLDPDDVDGFGEVDFSGEYAGMGYLARANGTRAAKKKTRDTYDTVEGELEASDGGEEKVATEGGTHVLFCGWEMAARSMLRMVLLTTSWAMADTTGNRTMKSKEIARMS
jgi:hypothetical protein